MPTLNFRIKYLVAALGFAATVINVAVPPATAGEGWLRDPTPGVSVLGGSSGSSGSGSVMHDTRPRGSNTYNPQRGKVRQYRSGGGGSSLINSVKPKDARKLTNEAVNLYTQAVADDRNGKYNDAVVKLRKSLAIREFYWASNDKNLPSVLCKLAEVLGKQKKYDEAIVTLDRSLAYCSRIFGPGTPDRIPTLVLMGEIYQKKSDLDKSFESYKQAYTLVERAKGKGPETTKIRIAMARVANRRSWNRTACELYKEILDDHAGGVGALPHGDLSSIAREYADVLRKEGREDEANAVLAKIGGTAATSAENSVEPSTSTEGSPTAKDGLTTAKDEATASASSAKGDSDPSKPANGEPKAAAK